MSKIVFGSIEYTVNYYVVDINGFPDTIQAGVSGKRIGVVQYMLTSSAYSTEAAFYSGSGFPSTQISNTIQLAPNVTASLNVGKLLYSTAVGEDLLISAGANPATGIVGYIIY